MNSHDASFILKYKSQGKVNGVEASESQQVGVGGVIPS